jgi:lysophospholipase L1-like esterase/SOS response regulatory protein OraA/RecX
MAIVIPSSIYQATPTEKARLYNSLLGQGYSDEEIRVAAGAPRDDNWALLQSIAQSLQPAQTPAPSLLEVAAPETSVASEEPVSSLLEVAAPDQATSLLETTQETANTAQQATRPTAVLFGDSMSEYVGYTADGNPDNKYGNSVADVISNNLGIQVTNLATGGETSNEALAGGSKFGAFQTYIEQNKPQYAIIRYGAADAIKNQDPATTLQSVQQMVDIAKANGVTPIIVGVSELYGAQNSKTGNIAGYIDPGAEKRASQINDGLKQIAQSAGVSFTDVRAATSAGTGDLLDGVHSNADFGKKMADAISEDIAAKGVIAEAKVPSLPANVDSLSNAEKGRLYNDLIGQGFTDAQIRTAARAESDQDWNALKQIAADVKNITPAQVEKQVQSSAAPEGLLSTQTSTSTPSRFSGLFSTGDELANKAQEILEASGKANDPRFTDSIVGSFVQNGVAYNVLGDGSLQGVIESPTGAVLVGGFTPTGEQATEGLDTRFEQTSLDRALGILANAAIAAGTGLALGPAGVGALGIPGAAAAGAGLTNLVNTADLESALKAAALGGLTAYGVQSLFPGAGTTVPVDDFLAADVAQLAAQGIPEDQIAQILTQEGLSSNVINAALDAQFGTSAPGSAKGLGTPSTPSGAEQVAVTGQNVTNLGALSSLAPALATVVPTQTLPSIQVTGQTIKPDLTVPEAVSAALPAVLGGTVQQVGVTGQTVPKTEPVAPAAAAVGSIIPGIQPAVPSAAEQVQVTEKKATTPSKESVAATLGTIIPSITAAVPSAAEQVQVTGTKATTPDITVPALSAALPAIPAAVKATLPEPVKPKEESLFKPSDILRLLTLLGGTAAAGTAGAGTIPVGSVPPSDRMIGSTTPQFGPDYYAAVQQYYNAYMPETPRNVAGPLQQWYENKYGA